MICCVCLLVVSDSSGAGSQRGQGSNRRFSSSSYKGNKGDDSRSVNFTMEDIFQATRNFSPSYKVGQGGFGTVYKATLRDGTVVAIKRAKKVVII